MRTSEQLPGGRLEYAVLAALWDMGKGSVRDIHERVGEPSKLVYTTTAKVVDRLLEKGLVRREIRGRRYLYRAAVPRQTVDRARARHSLRDLLHADPKPAIATLVDAMESIDPELLDELARVVEQRRKSRRVP
jgi:predicted transcriptional regulator